MQELFLYFLKKIYNPVKGVDKTRFYWAFLLNLFMIKYNRFKENVMSASKNPQKSAQQLRFEKEAKALQKNLQKRKKQQEELNRRKQEKEQNNG